MNRSFMHLHLGFDATGLDDLELHHIVVNSWEGGVDTEQASPLHLDWGYVLINASAKALSVFVLHCHLLLFKG